MHMPPTMTIRNAGFSATLKVHVHLQTFGRLRLKELCYLIQHYE